MSKVPLIVLAVLLVTLPATAQARQQQRVVRPPLPQPMPAVTYAACPGFVVDEVAGCVLDGRLYVADGERSTKLHELGHVYDDTMMDPGERSRFAKLLGESHEPWARLAQVDGQTVQADDSLSESFADAYASCRMSRNPNEIRETANYDVLPRQHRRICGVIARAGRDLGQPIAPDRDR